MTRALRSSASSSMLRYFALSSIASYTFEEALRESNYFIKDRAMYWQSHCSSCTCSVLVGERTAYLSTHLRGELEAALHL